MTTLMTIMEDYLNWRGEGEGSERIGGGGGEGGGKEGRGGA